METSALIALLRIEKHGVLATVAPEGAPQAATVGFAVCETDGRLELVLDTLATTRKAQNLRRDSRVACVITFDSQTFQLEGEADEPKGAERDRVVAAYLATFPDGAARQSWPGIIYVRIRVRWLRYSDFRGAEPIIIERSFT